MDRDAYLPHLERDGRRMADLARGDLTARVPTCPAWNLGDLIEHTGFVHRWQTAVVRDDAKDFPDPATWQHGPADGEALADWFRSGVEAALDAYRDVDPAAHRWTWFEPDQTAGWYPRRTTQETLVHRVDAELAAGVEVMPLPPVLAADGVDELFDVMVPATSPTPVGGDGQRVLLEAIDTDARWLVTLLADTVTADRQGGDADAVIRGSAGDLLMYVWGREPLRELSINGDQAAADLFFAACADEDDEEEGADSR